MKDVLLYGLAYGLGALSFTAPDGTKYDNLTQAQYDNLAKYGRDFNDLMAIAYRYNLPAPKWSQIYNKSQSEIDQLKINYQLMAEGKAQANSTIVNASTGATTYSFLIPGGGTNYLRTTDKAQFEAWNKAASLYNNCNSIAIKYGFNKPNWADFEAGRGEQILKQYQERAAAKIAADEAEARAIAEAEAARAKAAAEAAAAEAKAKAEQAAAEAARIKAEKAAAEEKAKKEKEAAEAKARAEAAKAEADRIKAEMEATGQQITAEQNADAEAAFAAAQREQEEQAAENKINLTPVTTAAETDSVEIPWWGWAFAAAIGATCIFALTRKKKKNRN